MAEPLRVLVNERNEHSLWPDWLDVPAGWKAVFLGDEEACKAYIDKHWTDLNIGTMSKQRAIASGTK
ncbi:MbtH family NRPS accessory protein [Bacillus sp. JCM 19041]|uniref:MbtH family NRPS accessory protein n=1 Tax=Bacillus sp. JCM 19041 TaxID=1460637 RepID=UPI000AB91DDD